MKKMRWLTRTFGTVLASLALVVAQVSSTQFSIIYYQDKAPESISTMKRK